MKEVDATPVEEIMRAQLVPLGSDSAQRAIQIRQHSERSSDVVGQRTTGVGCEERRPSPLHLWLILRRVRF